MLSIYVLSNCYQNNYPLRYLAIILVIDGSEILIDYKDNTDRK